MQQQPQRQWWQQNWLLGLLLVAATILAYQPAWNAGFIWDDDAYVTRNSLLTAPDGLKRIWFSTDSPSQYFPLTYTTFRLERSLWGLNSTGYHWVNILLHAANALLAWRLLRRLNVPGAWLAAAIFALHPVNVESVAWITELKNVQSLFFSLLALLAWVEFVEERDPRHAEAPGVPETGRARHSVRAEPELAKAGARAVTRPALWVTGSPVQWGFYLLALMFYALALFSKTTACTLPAALLLVLWLQRKPLTRPRLLQVVPFVAMGVAMGLLAMWWERHQQGTEGRVFALGLLDRILIASRAVWFYAGKLVWPANLTFNYPRWTINPADPLAYAWLLAGAGLCAAVYCARRFVGRSAEVAAVFYVATLSPLLGFIMLYTFHYTFVADHYQYVAMIGPAALAAAGLTKVFRSGAYSNVPASGSAAAPRRFEDAETGENGNTQHPTSNTQHPMDKSASGLAQSKTWRFLLHRLFQAALCGALLATLGVLTWRQCRMYADLETLWRTTLARNPQSFMALNNLGELLLQKGRLDEAMRYFQQTLEIRPDSAKAHCNLGAALFQSGQTDGAIRQYQKALEIQPDLAEAHKNLGDVYLQLGRVDEALAHSRKAVDIRPEFPEAQNNLGNALLQKGQVDEAIIHFQKAVDLLPDYPNALNNLGVALIQKGKTAVAMLLFQKAVDIQPDFAEAHNNLGRLQLQKGKVREAVAHYQAALKKQPDDPDTLCNLAWVLATWPEASVRNGPKAIELARRAHELSGGQSPAVLGTLAAAYAEGGRFAEAVTAAQRALQLAEAQSDAALADMLRSQIKLHQAGSPIRDNGMTDAAAHAGQP